MKAKPILMSTPMVISTLEERKTNTRRIIKPQPSFDKDGFFIWQINSNSQLICADESDLEFIAQFCPFGQVGDFLWVRETFEEWDDGVVYKATAGSEKAVSKWKPSIFMPKRLSRLTLKITDIRVERLQDISEEDAVQEGYPPSKGVECICPRLWFEQLWQSIHSKESWDSNPWVWVLEFEVIHKNIDEVLNDTASTT